MPDPIGNATAPLVNTIINMLPLVVALAVGLVVLRVIFGNRRLDHLILFGLGMVGVAVFLGYLPFWVIVLVIFAAVWLVVFPTINSITATTGGLNSSTNTSLLSSSPSLAPSEEEMLNLKVEVGKLKADLAEKVQIETTLTEELAEAEDEIYELEEKLREAEKHQTLDLPFHPLVPCPKCGTTDPRPHVEPDEPVMLKSWDEIQAEGVQAHPLKWTKPVPKEDEDAP